MILFIDNYDSFVYNLVRYIEELHEDTQVFRNDQISLDDIKKLEPNAIILSPGPCGPKESGICLEIIKELGETIPILGICLGHQAIGYCYGANVRRSHLPMHGKASLITHDGTGLFENIPSPLKVGRYHSLSVDPCDDLIANAHSPDGEIMAFKHRKNPVWGVQFHPESILTDFGHDLLRNFLSKAGIIK